MTNKTLEYTPIMSVNRNKLLKKAGLKKSSPATEKIYTDYMEDIDAMEIASKWFCIGSVLTMLLLHYV